MEGSRDLVEVASVETGDRDSTIGSHVNVVLAGHGVDLILSDARVSEHTNLRGDVAPVVLAAEGGESLDEASSHFSHTGRHEHEIIVPHLRELLVAEDDVDDSSTVDGRVRVHGSGNLLDSRVDLERLGGVASNEVHAAGSLTVETEVLGEGLEKAKSIGVVGKVSDRESILVKVSACETLIGTIESSKVTLSLNNFENFLPLVSSWILTCWVVSA